MRADVDDVDLADSFMPRPSGPAIGLSPADRYQQRTALDVSPDGLGEPVNGRRYPAVLGCRNGGRELSALVLT